MNFQGGSKDFVFKGADNDQLKVHSADGVNLFRYGWLDRKIGVLPYGNGIFAPFIQNRLKLIPMSWHNEAVQRNCACNYKNLVGDEDIVILSDVDEIIDSRFSDQIVNEVKKRGIITVRLHFTLFYLNLFSKNWGGPLS